MGDGFSPRGGRPRRDAETSKGPGNLRNELDDEGAANRLMQDWDVNY